MARPAQIRPSKEIMDIVRFVQARYLLAGKKPPSITQITGIIAKEVDKDKVFQKALIRF